MESKQQAKTLPITGTFCHTVDAKGRLIVPARWRVGIGADLYISPNPDGALVVMTEAEFRTVQDQVTASSASQDEKSRFIRRLASNTQITQMDRQGRINLAEDLMNKGGIELDKDVMLVGKFTRFEIYNLELWKRVEPTLDVPFDKLSREIGF